jgi:hypothetical protein
MAPTCKGQRLIIVHAGTEKGFTPGALLIFKSNQKTGDYHMEMSSDNYMLWIKEKLLPNLPKTAFSWLITPLFTICLVKGVLHICIKKDMKDWLLQHKIPSAVTS